MRLPVPSVGTALSLVRATVSWSMDTVALVAAMPSRIDDLFGRLDALLTSVEEITARAGEVIDAAARTTDDAAEVVVGAGDASARAQSMIAELQPIADRGIPLGRRFVDNFSEQELDASIRMVDQLPELMERMEAIMPILATMDTVAPEIHQLLEVTKDVRKAVIGIPGFKFFRNRGEEKLEDI
ncbi:ribulose 1,5-bisphosphate carboxylase large subunit [Rhodococcus corynebacterioides]|uniref:Ribulose 1,5-bisphosphate carboxylase large subunit n=1 Tax=Rhodococcoides corynebacterioides TaxID=53972 RepID=A0ABS7P2G2_9NOCA|nr:ribulose 1,5-bisphosphate carboxylase large subunit [Rhodococcus corynebacterioides]MBY6409254.1 ribulose 1,5-bisphosphate carboxylase large subunit [Rhodococcus corynebacterioides]